jgi:tetratricopeptide (TPR) repeat protein
MDETHLERAVLERFFLLEADKEETRRVFRHLVAGCEVCRQLASKVMREVYLSDEIYPIPQGEEIMGQHDLCDEEGWCEISLEQELDLNRSVAVMLEHMERSRRESEAAEERRARLLRANPKQRLWMVKNLPGMRTWGMYDLALREAEAWQRDRPAEARELALLALAICELLPEGEYGAYLLNDFKARALLCLANCRRIQVDLAGSLETLDRADELIEEGTGDPLVQARAASLRASTMTDLGRFEEAILLLEEAEAQYRMVEETWELNKTLLKRAYVLSFVDPAEGYKVAREAFKFFDGSGDLWSEAAAIANMMDCLSEAGLPERALAVYREHQERLQQVESSRFRLRIRWIWAKVVKQLDWEEEAILVLEEVAEEFENMDCIPEATFAKLDLIGLHVAGERWEDALALAAPALEVLKAAGLHEDAMGLWIYLIHAIEERVLRAETIRAITDRLRRFWSVPIPAQMRLL